MKLNWGTSIVIVLACFMTFIMYFFIKAHTMKQDDLVSEEYYDEGLLHDQREGWIKNAKDLAEDIKVVKDQAGKLTIALPKELHESALTIDVKFLRSNNAKLDVEYFSENQTTESIVFPAEKWVLGNYRLKAKIIAPTATYYWERNYTY